MNICLTEMTYSKGGKASISRKDGKWEDIPALPSCLQLLTCLIEDQKKFDKIKEDQRNCAQRKRVRMLATCRKKREAKV